MRDAPAGRPFVAVLSRQQQFWTAEPFFERGRRIVVERDKRLKEGALALLRTAGRGRGQAKVLKLVGSADVARDVIEALMLDRGLPRRFDPVVDRQAREAEPVDVDSRRDLRDLVTFTIDPASARDFDDAISCEALGENAWRVWIHIADVCAFVRPGSALDRDAHRRSTSVYVPGAVEPMLPPALSNEKCSLVPYAERLAVTVELEVRGSKIAKSSFYRSVIRSDERLDYDRVDRIFGGQEGAAEPWGTALSAARACARALGEPREQRALALDTAEPEFRFDTQGHVDHVMPVQQTESHKLIEHLMIAANEAVAGFLEDRKLPALYRVHERPQPAAVQKLAAQLASLDVPTPPVPEDLSPSQATDLAAEISHAVERHIQTTGQGRQGLTSLVLRSLKQATYTPENKGHAGLRSERYCHFTSPIRRYPDIVCHRSLLSALGAGEDVPERTRLGELGEWTSTREREAMTIERDADDVARCFVLERELFEGGDRAREFDGEVVGLIGAGAFVAFGDGYSGLLPVRRMRGDWWELNEEGTILHGTKHGGSIRLGQSVRVAVGAIDAPRGRVDLHPAAEAKGAREAKAPSAKPSSSKGPSKGPKPKPKPRSKGKPPPSRPAKGGKRRVGGRSGRKRSA